MEDSAHTDLEKAETNEFDWPVANVAEALVRVRLEKFLARNSFARDLNERMKNESGTDFFEWVDHLVIPPEHEGELKAAGYVLDETIETLPGERAFECPRATLPRIVLSSRRGPVTALRPECIDDFIASHNLRNEPDGEPFSRYRRVRVAQENATTLEAVERRAYRGFICRELSAAELRATLRVRELWRTRPRRFAEDSEGFAVASERLNRALQWVEPALACHLFFEAERRYWESRNLAGHIQKRRQDQLGLGWGNHDHHTFRCSREHFVDLVSFLLQLGFEKRERYYAGAEAGWGAQILEQPLAGIVVFADVDLMPEETAIDFSTRQLPKATRLGTVGLWVGLHGESFLEAGMHHLEARFDFVRLRDQLKACGIGTMKPFSDFEFLRQAFTEGERWAVRRERAERLCSAGLISRDELERFVREGALGSHLENLQRHGGFKGFNQKSVSAVIAATDPRNPHFAGTPVAA